MKLNLLIGGRAGQGMDTVCVFLEKVLKESGFYVFSNKDYMSRVRGGHNFTQIRFGDEPIYSHVEKLDLILALDRETIEIHSDKLDNKGTIIADEAIKYEDRRLTSLPLLKVAKDVGLPMAFTFVAAGSILKHFGIKGQFEDFISKKLPESTRNKNIESFKKGGELLEEKFALTVKDLSKHLIINGNDAIGLGALVGGVSFYSAYPMTPATSIMTYLSKKALETGIVVEQAEDEISAINMAIGASYAGARSMTGSSGGGVALMVEAFGLAGITETPLVVIDSQRPGPATGFPTRTEQSDLSFLLTAAQGEFPRIVLSVRNAEDAFYQTFRALNIADKYQILVILLTDQYLADSNITIPKFSLEELKIERHIWDGKGLDEEYKRYKVTKSGISPRLIPGKIEGQVVLVDSDEHTEYAHITEDIEVRNAQMEKRMRKLDLFIKEDLQEPEYFGGDDIDVLLVGWGSTYGAIREATETLNSSGLKVGALSFGDIYPLPDKLLIKYKAIAKKIINIEQNFTGQLGKLITQETGIIMNDSILKYDGRQITSNEIVTRLYKEV